MWVLAFVKKVAKVWVREEGCQIMRHRMSFPIWVLYLIHEGQMLNEVDVICFYVVEGRQPVIEVSCVRVSANSGISSAATHISWIFQGMSTLTCYPHFLYHIYIYICMCVCVCAWVCLWLFLLLTCIVGTVCSTYCPVGSYRPKQNLSIISHTCLWNLKI